MTTSEILTMALQIADAAHVTGPRPEVTITGPQSVMRAAPVCILVTPALNTGDYGTGEVLLSGSGKDLDDAAADLLPRLREAAVLVAYRLERQREHAAGRLAAIATATGGAP